MHKQKLNSLSISTGNQSSDTEEEVCGKLKGDSGMSSPVENTLRPFLDSPLPQAQPKQVIKHAKKPEKVTVPITL